MIAYSFEYMKYYGLLKNYFACAVISNAASKQFGSFRYWLLVLLAWSYSRLIHFLFDHRYSLHTIYNNSNEFENEQECLCVKIPSFEWVITLGAGTRLTIFSIYFNLFMSSLPQNNFENAQANWHAMGENNMNKNNNKKQYTNTN